MTNPAASQPLRLLALLLALGNAVFLVRVVQPAYAALACTLMALTLWPLFGGRGEKSDLRIWLIAAALALLLCLLGGEGRLFYANADWQNRDAILADLARRAWPLAYHGVDGGDWVMRAPLGMYVLPALAGWPWAHPALLIQNAALLASILVMVMSVARGWPARLLSVAVFVLFSGWDVVGQLLFNHFDQPPAWAHLFPHLENWARGLQYSSLITGLFWTPHHALPAWAMAVAYLCWRRETASWLQLAAITGLCVLWSPLAVIGAAPFVVLAGISDLARGRMKWRAPAILGPLVIALLPVAVFVTLATGAVAQGLNATAPGFAVLYLLFIPLEVLPLLYLSWRRPPDVPTPNRGDWWLAAIILLVMPAFKIGEANDLMMRGSIFPIALLALTAAQALVADLETRRYRRMAVPLIVLAIGAATPAAEIVRAVVEPVNPPKADDFITAWEASDFRAFSKAPYLARADAYAQWTWLLKPPPYGPNNRR